MGHRRAALREPRDLALGQVDGVGQDRALGQAAGAVIDVEVVVVPPGRGAPLRCTRPASSERWVCQ